MPIVGSGGGLRSASPVLADSESRTDLSDGDRAATAGARAACRGYCMSEVCAVCNFSS